jgi:hypothetical protein
MKFGTYVVTNFLHLMIFRHSNILINRCFITFLLKDYFFIFARRIFNDFRLRFRDVKRSQLLNKQYSYGYKFMLILHVVR